MISELATDFSAEVKGKQEALDVMQAHLRAATRELSEQRKQIQVVQAQCAEFDLVAQRTRNLEKALEGEDKFDTTGRTELDGTDAEPVAGPAFRVRGPGSTIGSSVDLSINLDSEPPIPTTDSVASLIRLRRLKLWSVRMEKLMEQRSSRLQGASAEKEFMCKKIVALCTGVPLDKVEDVSGQSLLMQTTQRLTWETHTAARESRHCRRERTSSDRHRSGFRLHAEGLCAYLCFSPSYLSSIYRFGMVLCDRTLWTHVSHFSRTLSFNSSICIIAQDFIHIILSGRCPRRNTHCS